MRRIIFLSLITPLAVVFFIVGQILDLFREKTPPVEKTKILAVRGFIICDRNRFLQRSL